MSSPSIDDASSAQMPDRTEPAGVRVCLICGHPTQLAFFGVWDRCGPCFLLSQVQPGLDFKPVQP